VDVAMFAVAVQDAQGRVVPITDNEVTFRVSGAAKLIGTGNGDPTNQESDKGTSRKAFSGWCMGVVQATKNPGTVTVEAASPGLVTSSVTIATRAVTIGRPEVAAWEREMPVGSGITGLWRPEPQKGETPTLLALIAGGGTMIFTLKQDGSSLTGDVEGTGGGFFGGNDVPIPVTEGKVDGDKVSFKAGNSTYSGTVKGDEIELQREVTSNFRLQIAPGEPAGGLAVGPPPDGSDPSINPSRRPTQSMPIVLRRVQQ
jgi:beta-galactosidase